MSRNEKTPILGTHVVSFQTISTIKPIWTGGDLNGYAEDGSKDLVKRLGKHGVEE